MPDPTTPRPIVSGSLFTQRILAVHDPAQRASLTPLELVNVNKPNGLFILCRPEDVALSVNGKVAINGEFVVNGTNLSEMDSFISQLEELRQKVVVLINENQTLKQQIQDESQTQKAQLRTELQAIESRVQASVNATVTSRLTNALSAYVTNNSFNGAIQRIKNALNTMFPSQESVIDQI